MSGFGMAIIRGRITALSAVHQSGSNSHGSLRPLNTQKWIIDGKPMDIPFISGNSVRGYLRRLLMQDFLERIGHKIDKNTAEGQRLYHALYTGGALEKSENIAEPLDLVKKARICDALPPVKLLGFTFGSQMIESTLNVGMMQPVCTELKDFLPADADPKCSVFDLISQQYGTRHDDIRGLTDAASNQMIYNHETFAAGTVFCHEFRIEDPTPLDLSTLARALALWREKPYIGGKSSSGFGLVGLKYDMDDDDAVYLAHCEAAKREASSVLRSIFTKRPKKPAAESVAPKTPAKRGRPKKSRG